MLYKNNVHSSTHLMLINSANVQFYPLWRLAAGKKIDKNKQKPTCGGQAPATARQKMQVSQNRHSCAKEKDGIPHKKRETNSTGENNYEKT